MDTPSKVTHERYAVAETRISGVRLITVIHVLKLFLRPLLTMYIFALSSRSQTHADKLPDVKTGCYRNHFILHDVYSPQTSADKYQKLCQVAQGFCQLKCTQLQLCCWMQGFMAPIVLLVASIDAIVIFFWIQLYYWIKMYVLLSSTVLLDKYSQMILVVLIVPTR